jgi:hypothetical protein
LEIPTASKRAPIVAGPSSHAVMPFPGVATAAAVASNCAFSDAVRNDPPKEKALDMLLATNIRAATRSGVHDATTVIMVKDSGNWKK